MRIFNYIVFSHDFFSMYVALFLWMINNSFYDFNGWLLKIFFIINKLVKRLQFVSRFWTSCGFQELDPILTFSF